MERKYTCCFTGHRPEKMPEIFGNKYKIRDLGDIFSFAIRKLYEDCGVVSFISGMARGGDLIFAETVDRLSRDIGVELICALPFTGQACRYHDDERDLYDRLCARNIVVALEDIYSSGCYMRRNRFMVDSSSRILALTNGAEGGTAATLRYAAKRSLSRALIDGRLNFTADMFFFGETE